MASVAKRLEIDFAPAMVGFEFRNGRSIPIFEGIVVCVEFKDAIVEVRNNFVMNGFMSYVTYLNAVERCIPFWSFWVRFTITLKF